MAGYAIISLGGKQYRVREGERLLVDRLPTEEGKTFHPEVLLLGGDGRFELAPKGSAVTVKVVGSPLGDKIRIGKYKPKKGYRRHTGFRAKLSQIEIESIGGTKRAPAKKEAPAAKKEPPAAKKEPPAAKKQAPAAKKEAPAAKKEETGPEALPSKLPQGYVDMTVKEIAQNARDWSAEQVEAALEYERAHAARKGALAALEAQEGSD
jgi:large subunit ribosomal protein L21